MNIHKSGSNTAGINTCNKRSMTLKKIKIRQIKYLNNILEQNHKNIKRRVAITAGFK